MSSRSKTEQLALDLASSGGLPPEPPKRRRGGAEPPPPPPPIPDTSLAEEAQRRYLNYAVSVITSRALPDVRDGLKPVQRRILYTMQHDLSLGPDAKPKKSARVVGDVMGKYHPHGDVAIYDAMVRMAQTFVMRAPLVEGHGNFGSIDGDAAAAMRYTEARLRPIATELLRELGQKTVGWRPNYEGTLFEPIVLPARYPNLLVNGAQGIAVGMATSIPPHNLSEVIDASLALIDKGRELTTVQLMSSVRGPDFPTGGQLHVTKKELEVIYETGSGSLKLRGEYDLEEDDDKKRGGERIVITSIPYGVERKAIVEKIAEIIINKKLAGLLDVRDESTEDVRVVCEIKRGTDPQLVMAYLYKNTPLQTSVQVNFTCLVPEGADPETQVATPKRVSLREMLTSFLDFRFATVTRRLTYDLGELRKKIHVLEGFEKIFDALDEVIKIIRKSDGRADAAEKLMQRFDLSEEQTTAILELRLYRLAKLEILLVRKELDEKRKEAKRLDILLKSDDKRWALVREELAEIKAKYGDKRRTKIVGATAEPEYQAEDFIALEDANVILSAQGWVKRVREVKDLSSTRLREGDAVLACVAGSTRASVAFFSNLGACYVCRLHDVPQSTGYGDPVQKLFKLGDGERMIAMLSLDPRAIVVPEPTDGATEPEPPFVLALTRGGLGFRFSLRAHREPSTRAGRRFARLNEGDEVMSVLTIGEDDSVICVASDGHALGVKVDDIGALSGAGKGAMVMKLDDDARLIGAQIAFAARDAVVAETDKGKEHSITLDRVLGARADRGQQIVKRDRFVRIAMTPVTAPSLEVT
jgi:DNA gyrase subunit A